MIIERKNKFFKLISATYESLSNDDNLLTEELFTKALFYTFSFNFAVINHFLMFESLFSSSLVKSVLFLPE